MMGSDARDQRREPVVSVAMLAFNHARYLEQSLESVLAQEVDFPIEIVVGEDCSTDGTREILLEFAARHPAVVRPLLHRTNVGLHSNASRVLEACHGEFVALLEGDDYWTDPRKLARQVAHLEANPDLAATFHPVDVRDEGGSPSRRRQLPADHSGRLGFLDLLQYCPILTCSVMFRRAALPTYPSWARELLMGDWPMFLTIASRGDFGQLDGTMAVYRVHPHGAWSQAGPEKQVAVLTAAYAAFARQYGGEHRALLARALTDNLLPTIRHLEDTGGATARVRRLLSTALRARFALGALPDSASARWWLRLRFPGAYRSLSRFTARSARKEENRAAAAIGSDDEDKPNR